MSAYHRMQTVHGYPMDEVRSALQKTVRRGLRDEAIWWAIEMNESGYGAYCWRTLMVITTEDIGMANPTLPARAVPRTNVRQPSAASPETPTRRRSTKGS